MGSLRKNLFYASALLTFTSGQIAFAEGAGEAIAGALYGSAQIIKEAGNIAVAGIQANADVKVAQINSDMAKDLTQMSADTSKYLADAQKDVALAQTYASAAISKMNNDGVTERLGMQLAELRSARQDALQAEREKRALEDKYNMARIALAEKQSDAAVKLARETANMQLTQLGLQNGYATTNNGDRLTVTRKGTANRVASNTSIGSKPSTVTDATASGDPSGNSTVTDQIARSVSDTSTEQSKASNGLSVTKQPKVAAKSRGAETTRDEILKTGPRSSNSAKLLSMVTGKNFKARTPRGAKAVSRVSGGGSLSAIPAKAFRESKAFAKVMAQNEARLIETLQKSNVGGSTRDVRHYVVAENEVQNPVRVSRGIASIGENSQASPRGRNIRTHQVFADEEVGQSPKPSRSGHSH